VSRSRVVAVLVPAGGEIEGVVVIDLLEEAAAVVAHDVDLDADLGERLLDEGRPQRDVLAPRRRQKLQREAVAGAHLEAGLVEQRDRLGLVVRILRRVRSGIELGRGRRMPGAEFCKIAEKLSTSTEFYPGPNTPQYPYDKAKAIALLDEAGFKVSSGNRFSLKLLAGAVGRGHLAVVDLHPAIALRGRHPGRHHAQRRRRLPQAGL